MPFWLVWALDAWGGPAGPADPAAMPPVTITNVDGWSFERYNDEIVLTCSQLDAGIAAAVRTAFSADVDEKAIRTYHAEVGRHLAETESSVRRIPPWEGDAGLRDALQTTFATWRKMWGEEVAQGIELTLTTDPRDATLAKLEQVTRDIDQKLEAANAEQRLAERAFAERHGAILVEDPSRVVQDVPTFTAPGVPPAGSVLSGNQHVEFAIAYWNARTDAWNRIVGATNMIAKADSKTFQEKRRDAEKILKHEIAAAKAVEGWQGDSTLPNALVAGATHLETALSKLSEFHAIAAQTKRTKAEVDRANALANAANQAIVDANATFDAAKQAFQERSHIPEYLAWRTAHPPTR